MNIPSPILAAATIWPACIEPLPATRPLYGGRVPAGFPSPAENYIEKELDANELLVSNRTATYFVRISGESMRGSWIRNGDIAVVDCSIEPIPGQVVVAVLDGDMLIKQLGRAPTGEVLLLPTNKRYPTLQVRAEQDFYIWGVVTWTLHRQLP